MKSCVDLFQFGERRLYIVEFRDAANCRRVAYFTIVRRLDVPHVVRLHGSFLGAVSARVWDESDSFLGEFRCYFS